MVGSGLDWGAPVRTPDPAGFTEPGPSYKPPGSGILTTPQDMSRSSFKCLFISLGKVEEWELGRGSGFPADQV